MSSASEEFELPDWAAEMPSFPEPPPETASPDISTGLPTSESLPEMMIFPDILPDLVTEPTSQNEPQFDASLLESLLPTVAETAPLPTPETLPTPTAIAPFEDMVVTPAAVTVVKATPGFEFVYGAILNLSSKLPAHSLRVEHEIPEGVEVIATSPAARQAGTKLIWTFDQVSAEQRLPLRVTVRTKDPAWKPAKNRAAFLARYSCRGAVIVPVVRQAMKVVLEPPAEVEVGSVGVFTLRVSNPGNWPLRGASVSVTASPELRILQPADFTLPDLASKQATSLPISVVAMQAGEGRLQAVVHPQEGPSGKASASCRLTTADLALRIEATDVWNVGREHSLTVIASNPGTAPARMTSIRFTIPTDLELLTETADYDPESRTIFRSVDFLAPQAEDRVELRLKPRSPGEIGLTAHAEIAAGLTAQAEFQAVVRIHPADSDSIVDRFVREVGFAPEETVENVRKSLPTPGAAPAPVREHPHVVFTLAETAYALPLAAVREVGRPPAITPLPGAPDWLAGVANIRGDIVSLVDLGAFLGEPALGLASERRLLIVAMPQGDGTAGLLVDRVSGLRAVPPAMIHDLAGNVDFPAAAYMRGVAETGGRPLVVLSPERLLTSPDFLPFGSA